AGRAPREGLTSYGRRALPPRLDLRTVNARAAPTTPTLAVRLHERSRPSTSVRCPLGRIRQEASAPSPLHMSEGGSQRAPRSLSSFGLHEAHVFRPYVSDEWIE